MPLATNGLAVLFVVLNINMAAFDATRHQWPSSPLCCPQCVLEGDGMRPTTVTSSVLTASTLGNVTPKQDTASALQAHTAKTATTVSLD